MRRTSTVPTLALAASVAALLLSGCATTPAVSAGVKVDPETRPACAANCETMGLRLAAVVLVRNSAGCVCAVLGRQGEAFHYLDQAVARGFVEPTIYKTDDRLRALHGTPAWQALISRIADARL